MLASEAVILCLNTSSVMEAAALVAEMKPFIKRFSVGAECFFGKEFEEIACCVIDNGCQLVMDTQFNCNYLVMERAVRALMALEPSVFTIQSFSGSRSISTAIANCKPGTMIFAATVPCWLSYEESRTVFGSEMIADHLVTKFTQEALEAGVDGVICPPEYLHLINFKKYKKMKKMVPGTVPKWAVTGKERRVTAPSYAVGAGADLIVMREVILQPPAGMSRTAAAEKVVKEVEEALRKRRD